MKKNMEKHSNTVLDPKNHSGYITPESDVGLQLSSTSDSGLQPPPWVVGLQKYPRIPRDPTSPKLSNFKYIDHVLRKLVCGHCQYKHKECNFQNCSFRFITSMVISNMKMSQLSITQFNVQKSQ